MLLELWLNSVQKLLFSFQIWIGLLCWLTFELTETTGWFLADGQIHLLHYLFHFIEVPFVLLAVVLNVAIFVAESAMPDVLEWPWLEGFICMDPAVFDIVSCPI